MTADEIYAWEVANLPHLAVTYGLPGLAVIGLLGALWGGRAYYRGYRDTRRAMYRNAGLEYGD